MKKVHFNENALKNALRCHINEERIDRLNEPIWRILKFDKLQNLGMDGQSCNSFFEGIVSKAEWFEFFNLLFASLRIYENFLTENEGFVLRLSLVPKHRPYPGNIGFDEFLKSLDTFRWPLLGTSKNSFENRDNVYEVQYGNVDNLESNIRYSIVNYRSTLTEELVSEIRHNLMKVDEISYRSIVEILREQLWFNAEMIISLDSTKV